LPARIRPCLSGLIVTALAYNPDAELFDADAVRPLMKALVHVM
jgi:hypothetical protein